MPSDFTRPSFSLTPRVTGGYNLAGSRDGIRGLHSRPPGAAPLSPACRGPASKPHPCCEEIAMFRDSSRRAPGHNPTSRRARPGRVPPRFVRPRLEFLEDRQLLTTFLVTNVNDSG